jgi:hypothetical protein
MQKSPAPKRTTNSQAKHTCLGCPGQIPANKTLCASCAEDMGYPRRAR